MATISNLTKAFLALLMVSTVAHAGVDDFQSLIDESISAKNKLAENLRKQVEKNEKKEKMDLPSDKKLVLREENEAGVENVASPSRGVVTVTSKSVKKSTADEAKSMKRLSEEIKDSE